MFSNNPADIERKHRASIEAMKQRDHEEWEAKYQEKCDRIYWQNGPCCAGCDHWRSSGGLFGDCTAGPIISGHDVARSMGWTWYTWTPPPGYPVTDHLHKCGLFKDDFDWQTLGPEYLRKIGAKPRDGT